MWIAPTLVAPFAPPILSRDSAPGVQKKSLYRAPARGQGALIFNYAYDSTLSAFCQGHSAPKQGFFASSHRKDTKIYWVFADLWGQLPADVKTEKRITDS